jgi:hypothetical protein
VRRPAAVVQLAPYYLAAGTRFRARPPVRRRRAGDALRASEVSAVEELMRSMTKRRALAALDAPTTPPVPAPEAAAGRRPGSASPMPRRTAYAKLLDSRCAPTLSHRTRELAPRSKRDVCA